MATYGNTEIGGKVFPSPKDPSDRVVYRMDYSDELDTGETISTRTVTITESGLIKDSDAINGSFVDVTVSGGTAGKRYPIVFSITTSNARELNRTGFVMVEEL